MDQGRPAIEFGATDKLPPYTFSRTDTRIDKGEHETRNVKLSTL